METNLYPTMSFMKLDDKVRRVAYRAWVQFNKKAGDYMWHFNIKLVWNMISKKLQKDGLLEDFNSTATYEERSNFIKSLDY